MDYANYWASAVPTADLGEPIDQSLRFTGAGRLVSADTKPSGDYTLSFWWKRGDDAAGSATDAFFTFTPNGGYVFVENSGIRVKDGGTLSVITDGDLRDYSAWYHICIISESGTSRCYVNGVKQSNTGAEPTGGVVMCIGSNQIASQDDAFVGYLAEFNLLDGTVVGDTNNILDEFGRYNEDGVWVPKKISFTAAQYGAKGFRLVFDSSANGGIGDDSAPTGTGHTAANDFTATGFDTAAISSSNEDNDIDYNDTPKNNYAVLNPLLKRSSSLNFEQGNLRVQFGSGGSHCGMVGFGMPGSSGKYYWEVTLKEQKEGGIGIVSEDFNLENGNNSFGMDSSGAGWEWIVSEGRRDNNGETPNSHTIPNVGDTIGFLLDTTAGECTIEINGVAQTANNGAKFTNIPTDKRIYPYFRLGGASGDANLDWNFGQFAFQHEPTGYQNLATNNLPEPTIKNGSDHFRALTGTGANISGIAQGTNTNGTNWNPDVNTGFTSGLWWIKDTANSANHQLVDSVRGTSTAFTLPGDLTASYAAPTGASVAWCWKYNASDPTENGFAIVQHTGNSTGSNTQNVAHNLGGVPDFFINFRIGDTVNPRTCWAWHGSAPTANQRLQLDNTTVGSTLTSHWGQPTATNLVFGPGDITNANGVNFITYVWRAVKGYSAFGKYTGNGDSNGTYVELGFRPALIILKSYDAGFDWQIYDTTRSPTNPALLTLNPNLPGTGASSGNDLDILSNGFKARDNGSINNNSGSNYLYMAWAENPFGGENAPPVTAR